MRKLLAAILLSLPMALFAQPYVQEGEFGIGLGAAHYFGDLNTKAKLNRPKFAAGLFFRKNFGNHIALRVQGNFAQVGYSDVYNTHNEFMRRRNLSFNSNIWEFALMGDFNFYRFMPGDPDFRFTPYVTFGVSAFSYNPYAYLAGEKYYLRELGTEGQYDTTYQDRRPYGSMAFAIPFGVGFKYSLNERINIGFEIVHRFTTTDYLDDVSRTYVDASSFPTIPDPNNPNGIPNPAFLLSDRSYETGTPIGAKGRMRGNSQNKDQFVTAMFYISFNLQSYRCPSVN
jgi:hypothetical protein